MIVWPYLRGSMALLKGVHGPIYEGPWPYLRGSMALFMGFSDIDTLRKTLQYRHKAQECQKHELILYKNISHEYSTIPCSAQLY